ncbi:hypothetical protein WJX79_007150 [Trebouxia sp. C0005]
MPGLRKPMLDAYSKTMGEKDLGSTLFDLEMDQVTASQVSGASMQNQLIANQHRLAPLLQPRETPELRVARDVCVYETLLISVRKDMRLCSTALQPGAHLGSGTAEVTLG